MTAEIIYGLCALASAACAFLLWRMYRRATVPLLLWCALGFLALTFNNVLLFADKIVFADLDLSLPRAATGVAGVAAICYGLIWNGDR